ncbi:glucose dehydrogenase [FAD, quinone]-like isoform X1 [Diorhabda carinulata]|uniref:glucose dehydrogenase [FAD, quinone]-like isoform X1 n=1 Tax=Diorhabda carinulata TaxID=1163345 RepID=UPI0025A241C9|nr:glucose dehydrogenase [FAD, quinone]-like isoform X1 [Diorhabda carinulata]
MASLTQQMNLFSMTRMALTLGPSIGFLIYLHSSIINLRPDLLDRDHRVQDVPLYQIRDTYDFVIVGGGSAGTVLANRLSENSDWKVLLLEAGPDEVVFTDLPIMFPVLQLTPFDWQYRTEPGENYCLGFHDKRCNWPRGRILGGSSVLNAMLYVRGNKKDYDRYRDLGNVGWSYEDVLPYFKKSENMTIPEFRNDKYHGKNGYLTIEHFRYFSKLVDWFLNAAQELGYEVRDINGEQQTGFTLAHGTLRDGLRCSTAKGFIRPIAKRTNLHVSLHSMVEKILINEETKQAYGVEFSKFGTKRTVHVAKEVILSAGAIGSPHLLMLSGIGPKQHLEDIGIKVTHHSPGVGQNLQDHVSIGGVAYLFDRPEEFGDEPLSFNLPKIFSTDTVNEFGRGYGPVYWLPVCEVMGFVNTKYQDPKEDWPDIQYFFGSFADSSDGGMFGRRAVGMTDEFYTAVYEDIIYREAFGIYILLLRPKSRGMIKLKDKNPQSHVLIYPNYFDHPDDLKVIVEGAKIAHNLTKTRFMQRFNVTFNPHRIPGCKDLDFLSDEYWACQAKHYTLTIYHPTGTAKMGPDNDSMAVLDPRLRVRGIDNLRVVDCSIFPYIPNGNTNAPVIMAAEKASDMIKEDWGVMNNDSDEDVIEIVDIDDDGKLFIEIYIVKNVCLSYPLIVATPFSFYYFGTKFCKFDK